MGVRPAAKKIEGWHRRTGCGALVALCAASLVPGCAWDEKIKVAKDGAPIYQELHVSYDVASTPDLQRLDQPAPIVQTAGFDRDGIPTHAKPIRPWAKRRVHLEVQYPCPGVHPAFARATLRIITDVTKPSVPDKPAAVAVKASPAGASVSVSQPAAKPDANEPAQLPPDEQADPAAIDEVLYLDIPKSEIDSLLRDLAEQDFFRRPSNPDGESRLLVTVNKGRCEKGWTHEQVLDKLVELLRRHGSPLPAPAVDPKKKKA
jgi:hypothetical protein